jgi:hypothetical protein
MASRAVRPQMVADLPDCGVAGTSVQQEFHRACA